MAQPIRTEDGIYILCLTRHPANAYTTSRDDPRDDRVPLPPDPGMPRIELPSIPFA
jgi:hypothetical protein